MIHLTNEAGIQTITLDINESNSFNLEAFSLLHSLLDKAKNEKSKVLILRSNREKVFSNGLNLAQLSGSPTDAVLGEFLNYFYSILEKIHSYPTPVIAEVSGHAMGYGAMLAIASDFRFGLEGMRIGLPEVKIGIGVPSFVSLLLSDIIGPRQASDHVLWGNAFKTSEALELGLFHEIYPDAEKLRDSVNKYVNRLVKNSISAMVSTKASLREISKNRTKLIEYDIAQTLASIKSEDAQEGIAASVAGRRPEFKF
ncbi:MAG: enoyl-CoA hydratase/isomerase family protein [Leptospira sp.]|nr:enoyl-CoA hydratase/isomerase family protein [Leptospira sp.]